MTTIAATIFQTELPYFFNQGQTNLGLKGFPNSVQGSLALGIKSTRGNPNFAPKWKTKTKAIRIPVGYSDQVLDLCRQWENEGWAPEGTNLDFDNGISSDNAIELPNNLIQLPVRAPKGIHDFPISELNLDPKRFQYKIIHGSTGSTGSLNGVRVWNNGLAGIVMVWQDKKDQKVYVVNGHNRITLAKSLDVEYVTVRFLDCETSKEARQIGAIANIAEGRGTALDAAKVFKDSKWDIHDLRNAGIPIKESVASNGLSLSKLSNFLFDKCVQGDLVLDWGIAIGSKLTDHDQQTDLYKLLQSEGKKRKITADTIGELAEIILAAETQDTQETTLFGTAIFNGSLALERAEIQSYIKQRLSREGRLFSTVATSRNCLELARGNNSIDTATSKAIAGRTKNALVIFDELKNLSGALSTAINQAVKAIANGGNATKIKESLYSQVLEITADPLVA